MKHRYLIFIITCFLLLGLTASAIDYPGKLAKKRTVIRQENASQLRISNRSGNPDYIKEPEKQKQEKFNTVKTLVPYEDLYKVLQKDIGKYFILPIEEFEGLKKAKEAWLASQSQPVEEAPPILYQIHSARIEGKIKNNFAYLDAYFKIQTHTDKWHEIPILWGSLAIDKVMLNGENTTLKTRWIDDSKRQLNFGKISKQNILQNYYQSMVSSQDTLSQNNWKDSLFTLPIKGKGRHECRISFMVPIQNQDDLYNLDFNIAQIPLTFLRLEVKDFILSIDSTSFKDYSVNQSSAANLACTFIGWLGAENNIDIKWRRKYTRALPKPEEVAKDPETVDQPKPDTKTATDTKPIEKPEPIITPLIYARSTTLMSLGETSIQGIKTIDYSISKAPVSSFSFAVPDNVEILRVNADRPHSYRQIRKSGTKHLRVDFMAGREDSCQIEVIFEAPVDLTSQVISVPEVTPIAIERELGTIAIEALTSVEIQPGNDEENPLGSGLYPLDPLEVPQNLKSRATRPILLAFRQNARPANIRLRVKRYQDVDQQTVVADRMEVKTTFTTNETSNTLLSMKIRNNNKQYLQLQLGSGSEVISSFRNGKPVKLVSSKVDGKVQIPLEMSQTVGSPVEMDLQVLLKQPVNKMKWRGSMKFQPPLVDIPVSRFIWQIFAPEQYKLYNFSGSVEHSKKRQDPFFFRGFMVLLKTAWNFIINPASVFIGLMVIFIILLALSRNILFAILKGIWSAITGIFSFIFKGKGVRLIELMIVLVIIAVLFAIATPNFRKAREQSREKACYANMRVLLGAVEMYNMDNPEHPMRNLQIQRLVDGKYLKGRITPPTSGCRYKNNGDLSENGYIYCQLHGAVDADIRPEQMERKGVAKRYDRNEMVADFAAPSQSMQKESLATQEIRRKRAPAGFGAAQAKGMLPIKSKFVMTKNHYSLERDLVIADLASDGAILANRTCPEVKFNYLWDTVLKIVEIAAFIMALFAGLYFISGAFLQYNSKITFAALIIIVLSIIDLQLGTVGEMANIGLWLALIGGFIWKVIWLITKLDIKGSDPKGPNTPGSKNSAAQSIPPLDSAKSTEDVSPRPQNSGKTSILLLILLSLFFVAGSPLLMAADTREIRVMAPFKELEKVVPTAERVVIIPEEDYEYLKDIVEPEPKVIKSPQNYRFENVTYKGQIEEKGVRFKAKFEVSLFNPGWKEVPLLSTSAIPSYASFDGEPLSLTTIKGDYFEAYGFMAQATGSHKVTVDFFIPLSSSDYRHTSKFNLQLLPVCLSKLEISVDEENCEAWIDPGVLKPVEKKEGQSVFTAIIPPTTNLKFELYRKTGSMPQKAEQARDAEEPDATPKEKETRKDKETQIIAEKIRITTREHNLLYFKEGFVNGINNYNLKINGGRGIASLSFTVPENIRILKVENKLIEDWKLSKDQQPNRLEIFFKSKVRGQTQINIEFEQEIQNMQSTEYQVPEIVLQGADQSYGILGIGCLQTLEISVSSSPQGYSPIIAGEFLKNWNKTRPEKTPYAFKFLRHPNELTLTITRPEDISQQTAVIDKAEAMTLLNQDGYMLTRIVYEVRNNSQQFLKVRLPEIASKTAALWSTQVAGESVRAGFDKNYGVYNLPIVRSPVINGQPQSFPVEIVYVIKTDKPLKAFNRLFAELPQAHLPVSELSWILYLPEGYELMRETGNVDRRMKHSKIKFLNNQNSYFSSIKSIQSTRNQVGQIQQSLQRQSRQQQDSSFSSSGMLPVKFSIPTTSWSITFSMLQIEPESKPPYIEGMLVNPHKGKGFFFKAIMIIIGFLASVSLVKLFTGKRKYLWFLFLVLQAGVVALAVYLKLYQADYFAQLGFSTTFTLYILYRFFAYIPEKAAKK